MQRDAKVYFETEYRDPERGGRYGCAVAVKAVDQLEDVLALRGMGERVIGGPNDRTFALDRIQRASKKLRRAAYLLSRIKDDASAREQVSDLLELMRAFGDCHHAGVFCAMLADRSGAAHVGAMTRDGGLLHEMSHSLFCSQLAVDRRKAAANLRRLAVRWSKLEESLPGLIP